MSLSKEEAFKIAKERGLIPQDSVLPKTELSKEEALEIALERGLVKPREDGAGFLTRTKFSFADTDTGRKQVLEDEYGKGSAYKVNGRWLIKDEKGLNYVDEDSLSWTDAADLIGDIPEMVGSGAGLFAGTGAGSIPLAMAGGAGGRGVKKVIAKALGVNDSQTATEITKDMLESGLWSGGGQALGLGVAKLGSKALAPFKNKMTNEAVLRKNNANKYGVELTPAQITQSKGLGQLETAMNNNFASVDKLAKFADEKQITPFNDAIKSITPNRNTDEIGMDLIEAINKTKNANKEMFKKEYGAIASKIDKPIEVNNLITQAQNILKQNSELPSSSMDTAVKLANEILEMPKSNMSYESLSKLRTNLASMAKSGNTTGDIGTAQYKLLKGALDKDFDTFATYNGLGSAKKDVDDAYRVFKNRYEDKTVKNIIGTEKRPEIAPENVVETIVKPNKTTMIENVTQASNNPRVVKDAVVDKVVNNAKIADYTNPMYGSDMATPTRFATQAHKYGENLAKVGADNVRELGKVAESIKFSDAFANHSNTAPTMMNSSIQGVLGSVPMHIGGKVYTSKLGRKWLTDGLGKVSSKKAGTTGAALGITSSINQ